MEEAGLVCGRGGGGGAGIRADAAVPGRAWPCLRTHLDANAKENRLGTVRSRSRGSWGSPHRRAGGRSPPHHITLCPALCAAAPGQSV